MFRRKKKPEEGKEGDDGGDTPKREVDWLGHKLAERQWTFTLTSGRHTVLLLHGTINGKRIVYVDGREVYRGQAPWLPSAVRRLAFEMRALEPLERGVRASLVW